jgi:uncharacterized protein (TIGR00290 family)
MNWSGGKDSAMALHQMLLSSNYNVTHLLTSVNSAYDRISMHGVRKSLLQQQAEAIGLPLNTTELGEQPGMEEYEQCMQNAVLKLIDSGCTHAVFGDIFLEDLRQYRENKLHELGVQCVFPLWKQDTSELMKAFIAAGFRAIVVCVDERYVDKSFCGRIIDESFLRDLPAGVDACGENGEYHTFVFEGPIYRRPILFEIGDIVYRKYRTPSDSDSCRTTSDATHTGFYFCDILPSNP